MEELSASKNSHFGLFIYIILGVIKASQLLAYLYRDLMSPFKQMFIIEILASSGTRSSGNLQKQHIQF